MAGVEGGQAGRRRRSAAAFVLSIALLAAVALVPAGAAEREGVQPRAAGDAVGGLKPSKYINGMLDVITAAAGLTGPQGFFLGAAMFVIKEIVSSADEAEDAAYAKLVEIGDQIAALREDVGTEFFQLQVGKTDDWITDIRETARDLREALEHAKRADKPALSKQEREAELRAFNGRKAEFIEGARALATNKVAAKLNDALIYHQEVGNPQNPERRPALLPALRRRLADERFLTAEVSRRIRAFYEYYAWWQTRLAAVLSEYYMLGGHCLWATPGTPLADGCETPPEPDSVSARDRVTEIKGYIENQRNVAGIPPVPVGDDPLRGKAFIDTKNNRMWWIEPTYRGAAQITRTGNYAECGVRDNFEAKCQFAATNRLAGYSDWLVPKKDEALSLFQGQKGTAMSWLRKAGGISFDRAGDRFPGYGGGFLDVRFGLLLRNQWNLSPPEREWIWEKHKRSIKGDVVALEYRTGGPLDEPKLADQVVARGCPVHESLIPYYPIYNAPDCKSPASSAGGFILWTRAVTAADRQSYYILPPP